MATWEDPLRGLAWYATIPCAPDGGLLLPQVPAGTVTLSKREYYEVVEGTEVVLELAPGEEREVTLVP